MLTWFMDPIHWFGEGGIFPLLAQHISYSAVALAIAFIIAFPVGCYTGHTGKGKACSSVPPTPCAPCPHLG